MYWIMFGELSGNVYNGIGKKLKIKNINFM